MLIDGGDDYDDYGDGDDAVLVGGGGDNGVGDGDGDVMIGSFRCRSV